MNTDREAQATADEAGKILGLVRAGRRGEALTELRLSTRLASIKEFMRHWHGEEWGRFATWAIGEDLR